MRKIINFIGTALALGISLCDVQAAVSSVHLVGEGDLGKTNVLETNESWRFWGDSTIDLQFQFDGATSANRLRLASYFGTSDASGTGMIAVSSGVYFVRSSNEQSPVFFDGATPHIVTFRDVDGSALAGVLFGSDDNWMRLRSNADSTSGGYLTGWLKLDISSGGDLVTPIALVIDGAGKSGAVSANTAEIAYQAALVPEPSSSLLLLGGSLGFVLLRKRS